MANMPDRLGAAVAALERAQAAEVETRKLAAERAKAEIAAARAEVAKKREELAAEIVTAARAGARQVDIVRATGYTRERVRQILRAGGVEPEA